MHPYPCIKDIERVSQAREQSQHQPQPKPQPRRQQREEEEEQQQQQQQQTRRREAAKILVEQIKLLQQREEETRVFLSGFIFREGIPHTAPSQRREDGVGILTDTHTQRMGEVGGTEEDRAESTTDNSDDDDEDDERENNENGGSPEGDHECNIAEREVTNNVTKMAGDEDAKRTESGGGGGGEDAEISVMRTNEEMKVDQTSPASSLTTNSPPQQKQKASTLTPEYAIRNGSQPSSPSVLGSMGATTTLHSLSSTSVPPCDTTTKIPQTTTTTTPLVPLSSSIDIMSDDGVDRTKGQPATSLAWELANARIEATVLHQRAGALTSASIAEKRYYRSLFCDALRHMCAGDISFREIEDVFSRALEK